jgi:hypothetical protein
MRPNSGTLDRVETNFANTEDQEEFGFDPEALEHLMELLSDMYGDPVMAIVREYITNAIDSHKKAGQTRPVEVTLPSHLRPFYEIRDFGTGMDEQEMRNTYVKYGASSKRNSDDFNGTLGIGSKSAFAYSNQFTVTAYCNGQVVTGIATRNTADSDVPVLSITHRGVTDEPNGVRVSIPIKWHEAVITRVYQFCGLLPKGQVLVNGKDLSTRDQWTLIASNVLDDAGKKVVIENLYTVPLELTDGSDVIYMGGVAYPANLGISTYMRPRGRSILAEVSIGAVQFAPSRESLKDRPLTRKVIEFVGNVYKTHAVAVATDQIKNAASRSEAISLWFDYQNMFTDTQTSASVKYDNLEFPRSAWTGKTFPHFAGKDTYNSFRRRQIDYRRLDQYLFVSGFDKDGLSSTHKRKARLWAENNGYEFVSEYYFDRYRDDPSRIIAYTPLCFMVLVDDPKEITSDPWLADVNWITWEEIANTKLPSKPRASRGGGGVSFGGQHFIYDRATGDLVKRFVDPQKDKNLVVISHASEKRKHGMDDHSFCILLNNYGLVDKDVTFVCIYEGRIAKFMRDFPNATRKTIDDLQTEIATARYNALTDDDFLRAAYLDSTGVFWQIRLLKSKQNEILDPDVTFGIDFTGNDATNLIARRGAPMPLSDKQYAAIKERYRQAEKIVSDKAKVIMQRYPLLNLLSSGRSLTPEIQSAMIEYLNDQFTKNGKVNP